jgi:hypothetical protein
MYLLVYSTNTIFFLKLLPQVCRGDSSLSSCGARTPIIDVAEKGKRESKMAGFAD